MNEELFSRAKRVLPGGVSSPVRAFGSVGGTPRFIVRGEGSRVFDAEGRCYLDMMSSWGPLIAGSAHPAVVEAIERAARDGATFGAPTVAEVELAEHIVDAIPSIEMLRFVSSGTEAAMSAVRLARAATGRDLIVKFAGGYHGHSDSMLVQAGSGVATLGLPDSPGVTAAASAGTVVVAYNDIPAVEEAFAGHPDRIAAIIVEPIAANMGVVPARDGFLHRLRALCDEHGSLLIFDEVVTGFRVARSGAQGLFGITPDLTLLGKIIGGGLPAAAFGGRADLLRLVAPCGPVYQAGTLSGNPVAMAAGLATLRLLDAAAYERLEERAARLEAGLIEAVGSDATRVNRVGSMLTLFFTRAEVVDFASAQTSDATTFARFFHGMLDAGVLFPPSRLEAAFVSLAHTSGDIEQVIEAATSTVKEIL